MMVVERYSHIMHLTSQVSGSLAPGQGSDRRPAGHPAGRHAVRGAEGAGHGDHRRPRADQAGRLRRGRRLPRLLRQPRHGHRHPHHDGGPRRAGVGAGRGRHRGRQRSGLRERRVRPQGGRHPVGGGHGPGSRRLRPTVPRRGPGPADLGAGRCVRRAAHAAAARVVPATCCRCPGPDAAAYLQGQCSQDLAGLAVGGSAEALLLSPQGKVDAYVRVTRTGDEHVRPRHRSGMRRCRQGPPRAVPAADEGDDRARSSGCACRVRGPAASPALVRGAGRERRSWCCRWRGRVWSGVDLLGPPPRGRTAGVGRPTRCVRCDEEPGRRPGSRPACRSAGGR